MVNKGRKFYFYLLCIVCLVLVLALFTNCRDAERELIFKRLNTVGEDTSAFIKYFNELKYENKLEFELKDPFASLDEKYKKLYYLILNNKDALDKTEYTYFTENYVTSYESIREAVALYLDSNNNNIPEKTFTKLYNKIGENVNLFINTHNNFIKLLENA